MAHGLSCPVACDVFPDQGLNPCLPQRQGDPYPPHHQGSPRQSLAAVNHSSISGLLLPPLMPHVTFHWPHMVVGAGEDPQPSLWGKQPRLRWTSWHSPAEGRASLGRSRTGQHDQEGCAGASLMAHWRRSHLPMQETWVQSLVWEDPTCLRATKPVHSC